MSIYPKTIPILKEVEGGEEKKGVPCPIPKD
jgi:hypothetical protein